MKVTKLTEKVEDSEFWYRSCGVDHLTFGFSLCTKDLSLMMSLNLIFLEKFA